ncbi:inositol polyphosphate 5 phosphatase OCRL 1 [Trichuris trichiura]|uniref:Inositol polyphosphate 5 phosphatase OCRL 1 n=1 Tax=Trichuris trichiura TaxID=36087 RepID=A0A077ZF56_TRITR|nr:inositol polyphosphate 5 phosphatase OCRL 1 [Trichuris trichiura]
MADQNNSGGEFDLEENHFAVDGAEVLAATQQPKSTLPADTSSMFYNHRNSIAESGGVVSYILQLREQEYCTYRKVRFQELDLSQQTFLFDTTVREEQWARTVFVHLLKLGIYFEVKRVRLIGIYLLLYASEELYLRNAIRDIDVAAVGTGLLNRLGNKGGVSIRFRIFDSTCCLVNCHFASGVDELERRNQDYRVISKIQFDRFSNSFERLGIFDHDYIFWFGDMNYRLQNLERYMLDRANRSELHTQFLKYDQLADMRSRGLIFQDFKEGAIEFLPTYKYDIGTDNWDSSEKFRVPAWCDRILWSGDGKVRQLLYDSVQPIRLSDHKPVRALFELEAKVVDHQKYKVVFESALKESDRLENEWLPQVALSTLEFTFEKVAFLEPQCQTLTITNTGRVPVHFEFSAKPGEQAFCRPWLLVTPGSHKIKVGEKCLVDVQVLVDKETVWAINEGRERLTDILVLHLNQGKDFFITVMATYVRSCFGLSLETLANITYPVRGIPTGDLLHLDSPVKPPRKVPSSVPKEVFRLVEHLRQNGLDQESLFSQAGSHAEFLAIRDALDVGCPEVLPGSVHSAAEALLRFFDSLPEPLIPWSCRDLCLQCSHDSELCRRAVKMFPTCHLATFTYLLNFLKEVVKHEANNQCTAEILGVIFAPILCRFKETKSQAASRQLALQQKLQSASRFLISLLKSDQSAV